MDEEKATVDTSDTATEKPESRVYSEEEWNTGTKRARLAGERDGARKGKTELLKTLGVTNEEELLALIDTAKAAKAAEPTPEQAELGKLRQKYESELAARKAELDAMKAAAERAKIIAEASKHLDDVFDRDLFLARYGLTPEADHRLAVVDGQVAVVDRDGEVVETNLSKFLKAEKSKLPWLVKGRGGGTGTQSPPVQTVAEAQPQSLADALRKAFSER